MLLPAAARELADPDRAELQRRLLGRPRLHAAPTARPSSRSSRQFAEHINARGWDEHALPVLPQRQERLQAQRLVARVVPLAARRAGATSRTSGRSATSARPSTRGSARPAPATAKLVFRADVSRPQWQRDSLDGLLDYNVVGGAMRRYRRIVIDRKAAEGQLVVEYGSANADRGGERAAGRPGASTPGRSAATASLPWQTVGTRRLVERRPTRCRCSIPGRAGRPPGPLDPPQGVPPRPAGRRVPDLLFSRRPDPGPSADVSARR